MGHEENYAAEVRVRTLLGRLKCEGAEPSSVREKDIYRILELNEVTDVEALYKTSGERFVLIFGSEDSVSKCRSAELSAVSGDARVTLLFRERRRAPIFVTIFCPEYISCRAVELAFSNFGQVERVFYGTHKFHRNIRNGKRHIRIFPTGGDPRILPRRITFPDGISRDVLYKEKLVTCYRCNTRHTLGESCPDVVSKETDVAFPEQHRSPSDSTTSLPEPTATDEASTVVDEHRQAEVESIPESLPNQSDADSEVSDSGTLEEGEIEDDSAPTVQEVHTNLFLRKLSLNPFQNLPAPKPTHLQQTLFKSNFRLKRIYHKNAKAELIRRFNIPDSSKLRFESAFRSTFDLAIQNNMYLFYKRLETDTEKFNMEFNWDFSVDEYHAHLRNILELTSDLWNGSVGMTG